MSKQTSLSELTLRASQFVGVLGTERRCKRPQSGLYKDRDNSEESDVEIEEQSRLPLRPPVWVRKSDNKRFKIKIIGPTLVDQHIDTAMQPLPISDSEAAAVLLSMVDHITGPTDGP